MKEVAIQPTVIIRLEVFFLQDFNFADIYIIYVCNIYKISFTMPNECLNLAEVNRIEISIPTWNVFWQVMKMVTFEVFLVCYSLTCVQICMSDFLWIFLFVWFANIFSSMDSLYLFLLIIDWFITWSSSSIFWKRLKILTLT